MKVIYLGLHGTKLATLYISLIFLNYGNNGKLVSMLFTYLIKYRQIWYLLCHSIVYTLRLLKTGTFPRTEQKMNWYKKERERGWREDGRKREKEEGRKEE